MNDVRSSLPDQEARDTFATGLEQNFSVLAPAGVGKTTSIVNRIIEIARCDEKRSDGEQRLPSLVVVTYTNKAADEMLARVRDAVQTAFNRPETSALLNQAFFGTIHRFCQRVISLAGPLVGLPAKLNVTPDEDSLWRRFRHSLGDFGRTLSEEEHRDFSIHGSWEAVFDLARKWEVHAIEDDDGRPQRSGSAPLPDGTELLSIPAKGRGAQSIQDGQHRFRNWLVRVQAQLRSTEPLPCQEPTFDKGGKLFEACAQDTLRDLRTWRKAITTRLAKEVAAAYRDFRLEEQEVTFDDLIYWANRLVKDPIARTFLRQRNWIFILDEAQDTDPLQFEVFLQLARPPEAQSDWPGAESEHPPRPGHFCMVGDPQQSIYSQRADLSYYLGVHRALVAAGGAELVFSVTMRCPQNVVRGLNSVFPRVLCQQSSQSGQVDYIRLHYPMGAATGQLAKIPLPTLQVAETKLSSDEAEKQYATAFARWFKTLTLESLQARSWDQVAILCARNNWVEALGSALDAEGIRYRQISRGLVKADSPTHAWPLALLHVFTHPRDSFELYGVMRDILGLKDAEILKYIEAHRVPGKQHPLRIDVAPDSLREGCPVSATLAGLHSYWVQVQSLPLYEAVRALFEIFALEERIQLHPLVRRSEAKNVLKKWVQDAAAAEANQKTLEEWVRDQQVLLRKALDEEEGADVDDSSVLLTCHKSKGLGWDAVILPFMGRQQFSRTEGYPRCHFSSGAEPQVELGKYDSMEGRKLVRSRRQQEEQERLLYVAMTRTKHSLILIDDLDFWKTGPSSFSLRLGLDKGNPDTWEWWQALPDSLQPISHPQGPHLLSNEEVTLFSQPAPTSCDYWKRVTPSSLQQHEGIFHERDEPDRLFHPDYKEEIRTLDPAAYGNWWHDMMENAPWEADLSAFRTYCFESIERCPQGKEERAHREITALLEVPVIHQLMKPEWLVLCEVTMLNGNSDTKTAYEGYIDLLAVNKDTGEWLVLDWKTDQIPSDNPQAMLLKAYGPQLAVYADSVRSSFNNKGSCGLYSTVLAQWILVPNE